MNPRILIIESCEKKINRDYSNTSIVHVRNSLIIADILKADLITHESEIEPHTGKKYDHIICMYASPYMKYKKYIGLLEDNLAARFYWLVNDHDLEDNILLRNMVKKHGIKYDMICNNARGSYRSWILNKKVADGVLNDYIENWYHINLNVLIFNESARKEQVFFEQDCLFPTERRGTIYYGTFRKWRSDDLREYNVLNYWLSTSEKNKVKYQQAGIQPEHFIQRLDWTKGKETLAKFRYSFYVEDQHTHTNFAFMANRYYECLMCGVLMFFDYRCKETIEKSGYDVPSFLIGTPEEIAKTIESFEKEPVARQRYLKLQEDNIPLILQEKTEVIEELKNIFNEA